MAFDRLFRCRKTIADGYLRKQQATVVQQSIAQSAMENWRRPHTFDHVFLRSAS